MAALRLTLIHQPQPQLRTCGSLKVSTRAWRCFTLQLPSSRSATQLWLAHIPPSTSSASASSVHRQMGAAEHASGCCYCYCYFSGLGI